MTTTPNAPCPACDGKELTKHVALLPLVIDGVAMEPHRYAVGDNCYREQWKEVYPDEECPVTTSKKS